ncbi:TIGR01244 family sulfur transferase [Phaeovulum sp. W22_SRMD_FR3]|uniref:TIGR01244 family sulfur transferase n=1 Tax=Phaeovulum sp. W22_SRMD_FR3 TaxID=3240274 RepID=UPI003F9688DB
MDLRQITPDFAVAPQITLEDVAAIAAAGFRTLLNNRPDDEIGAELDAAAMEKAARAAGLEYRHLPFWPGQMTRDLVEGFEAALAECPAPVLAYCRSGTRSSNLWAMAQAGHLEIETILSATAEAGYDLGSLVPALAARAASR